MRKFESEMDALKECDHNAHKWLVDNTNPTQWSRSHFRETTKCDILLNNLCESFNSVILEAREKPVLGMLETIRIYLMDRMWIKREWMKKRTDVICPKIQKSLKRPKLRLPPILLDTQTAKDSKCGISTLEPMLLMSIDAHARVESGSTWDCPCCHAVCCIPLINATPEDHVHNCYSREAYLAAYEPAIAPLLGPNAWRDSGKILILPPKKLRLSDRPKKARRREPNEPRKLVGHGTGRGPSLNSSKCQRYGHNRRTCPTSHPKGHSDVVGTDLDHSQAAQLRGEQPVAGEGCQVDIQIVVHEENVSSAHSTEVVELKKKIKCYFC
ncbi:uncharacterized protein [Coffea arabica]|uniref:Uncharacterized protein n=1 Tax=Coffea arabica TaxID=13443 RepID=A0ABM4VZ94_COFAR